MRKHATVVLFYRIRHASGVLFPFLCESFAAIVAQFKKNREKYLKTVEITRRLCYNV